MFIEKGVEARLDEYAPDAVAIERIFARSDVSTIMGTAQAAGIAMVCAARRGLPVALHTPSEVKAAVSGNGRADKAQVGAMVTRILRLDAPPKPADAADALALAITHIWRGGTQARLDAGRLAAAAPVQARSPHPGGVPMIAFVRGNVAAVTLSSAILEVGGVGLELMCTPGTIAQLRTGRQATLPTSMVVREDSLTLYGFADEEEKAIFELVQTASGVGPKVAQSIIAVLSPDGVRTAIATEDVKTLTKVPGIGQKGAQRIILELKDRIGAADRCRQLPVRRAPRPRGATRSTRGWSASATTRRTPRRPSMRSPTRPTAVPRTSVPCCGPRCAACRRRDRSCPSTRTSSKQLRRSTSGR